jgi:hypothetical protein
LGKEAGEKGVEVGKKGVEKIKETGKRKKVHKIMISTF